ncbi:glycosyltransferase family A protein [Salegentibacter salegens]|uniref:glycosyltransferase family A protein n=1 Tax=Salegentibacter salegens TaxID=143223 RepID=UPI0021D36806|nr:glycosyltransferase family A protein [Salegentibacter salegens]
MLEQSYRYLKKDNRFKFLKRPETYIKGAPSCRNYGFENSKGQFINYLDSDDLLSSKKIESQVQALKSCSGLIVACCSWGLFSINPEKEFDEKFLPYEDKIYTPFNFFKNLGEANTYIPPHCYLVPREIIIRSGGWIEDLQNNQDGEFFVRVLLRSKGIRFVKNTKVYYRNSTGDNVSAYSSSEKVDSVVRSWHLIESNLLEEFKMQNFKYVEASKNRLFQNILWENPELVNNHPKFFRDQLRRRRLAEIYKPFLKLQRIFKRAISKLIGLLKKKISSL